MGLKFGPAGFVLPHRACSILISLPIQMGIAAGLREARPAPGDQRITVIPVIHKDALIPRAPAPPCAGHGWR